ncbi:hypothetical protein NEF87_003269 [Candidatus Lokiarchaeum ossiferum]|uniref:Helicase HerA central domain-containing protein n=1 Tax=Candidatus Lokiarchaeum ossiferum TaxID=2951803 RepID=A0ABY6HWP3_9ARCH|nr:hypothetical protein NEF87_003269 [Candidatus Lokiarchaeum sp. B-35]
MTDKSPVVESNAIAKIEGKTTPFGFEVNLIHPIHKNSYLSAQCEDKNYVLGIQQLWNDQNGYHAKVNVIGEPPLSPFDISTEIYDAKDEEIKDAIGLNIMDEQALHLGKILHTTIDGNINVEKLGRVFITGKSGSGKSYTVGVIIEELMKKRIPLVIIDRHGEYSSLKLLDKENIPPEEAFFKLEDREKKYAASIIEFGDLKVNPGADLNLDYLLAANIEDLITSGNVIIINLSGLDIPVQENFVNHFCYQLYKASTLRKIPPHYLFIDEAHLFAGKKKTAITKTLKLSAQEGRKFGHNLVVITQKPQLLDVTIRAQAGTWIIHKLTDLNDIKITCNSAEGLTNDADEEIQNLSPGEAIITGDVSPFCPLYVKIRKRYTIHGGAGYNPLDFIENGEILPKAALVERLRNSFNPSILEEASQDVLKTQKLSPSELYARIDELRKENLNMKQNLLDLESQKTVKMEDISKNNIESEKTTLLHDINDLIPNLNAENSDTPLPGEMYDEKMLEIMEEKDDLTIQLQETIDDRDAIRVLQQTLQLEMSGVKVENEELKAKLKNETKRADDAVALAERCVAAMKKKKR